MQLPKRRWETRNAAPVLEVDKLCVEYVGKPVLKSLSLTVRRGEVVVLLGRSGSGKSTLLKSILALTPRSSGLIQTEGHFMGTDEQGRPLAQRHLPANRARSGIGIVFQHFALFDHLSALENVMSIPLRVQGEQPEIARGKAMRALKMVGLEDFAASLPHELSGGQKQRVGIARALAAEPQVLLFDEPTSALDPELVREVNQTMRTLAQTGITMIISTHDIAFAAGVADRVVFLQNGQLIEEGPPAILKQPATRDFATFLEHEQETQHVHA
jgi:polar amino acid transport system permease protein